MITVISNHSTSSNNNLVLIVLVIIAIMITAIIQYNNSKESTSILCAGYRRPIFEQACTANLVILVSPIFSEAGAGKMACKLGRPRGEGQDCACSLGNLGLKSTRWGEGTDKLVILQPCTT